MKVLFKKYAHYESICLKITDHSYIDLINKFIRYPIVTCQGIDPSLVKY